MAILKNGSIIEVIAPGYRCSEEELKRSLKFLESWNLKYRVSDEIFGEDLLSANSEPKRWKQFKAAIERKDSRVIWCVRGGYGSNHLLPHMHKMKKPVQQKWIVGLSDITSLQNAVYRLWRWPSVHASILERLGSGVVGANDFQTLQHLLFNEKIELRSTPLTSVNSAAQKLRHLEGVVLGGNLTVFQSMIGTPFLPSLKKKILFFEDIGERGYRVDRALHQLVQAGIMKDVAGLIFGDFAGGLEPSHAQFANQSLVFPVIERFAEHLKIPVYRGYPLGHGNEQYPLLLGVRSKLVKAKNQFVLEQKYEAKK